MYCKLVVCLLLWMMMVCDLEAKKVVHKERDDYEVLMRQKYELKHYCKVSGQCTAIPGQPLNPFCRCPDDPCQACNHLGYCAHAHKRFCKLCTLNGKCTKRRGSISSHIICLCPVEPCQTCDQFEGVCVNTNKRRCAHLSEPETKK